MSHPPKQAQIGTSVSVHPSVFCSDQLICEDNVIIERGVIFVEDPKANTIIREGARIGAGAIIGTGIEIGWGAYVQPGAVVLSSIPANAVASGNPAQIVGYTTELPGGRDTIVRTNTPANRRAIEITPLDVGNAALYDMPKVLDLRGNLTVGEFDDTFPFPPKRYFVVFDVPSEKLRGEHAHHACHQFLICLSGSCTALLDDGVTRQEVVLDSPDTGLYMPPMIWGTQYRYSRDAVLMVFASHSYDGDDYIRDYDSFRALTQGG
jgi:UDP-2-acetamido-3-amino-2,3-dideoxy-glucuronate N-acetyltransferase|tara:strand:- start:3538 stop:4329 length:792 start_codon:yes stop_codon:yes gene_type:complete